MGYFEIDTPEGAGKRKAGVLSVLMALSVASTCSIAFAAERVEEPPLDASEIAARAVASVIDGSAEGALDDLAAGAYDAVARDLLIRIETIEKEQGKVARDLEGPLFELGKLYVSADQCRNAIPILRQAILLTQRLDGVMNARQLPMHEPLLECLVGLDIQHELIRAQEHMLLVNESLYGKADARTLPALAHAGEWYERAGWYENALEIYARAMKIARKAGGENDIRLVAPLRAAARTYRLQAQFEPETWRGRAVDAQGQRHLERAARIVRDSEGVDAGLKIETLLELGDWYQIGGAIRDAQNLYREVWSAAESVGQAGASWLGRPEPLLYRAAMGVALRRPPPPQKDLRKYWVDFRFTVTRLGEVKDVVVENTGTPGTPRDVQLGVTEGLKRTRYRPRFVDGNAVDTSGLRLRQGVWVAP